MESVKLSIQDYHRHPAFGSSDLKNALKSPLHMTTARAESKDSRAMRIGSALHCAVLERDEFEGRYYAMPEFKGAGAVARREVFKSNRASATALSKDEMATVLAMDFAVKMHPTAMGFLSGGEAETSHFWTHPEFGLQLKCRPDYLNKSTGLVIDLKTCADASPSGFVRSVINYQYHLQAALYLDVLAGSADVRPEFLFIAVENEPPHAVGIYILEAQAIVRGRELYTKALENIQASIIDPKHNLSYSTKIKTLSLPPYAYYEDQNV